MWDRIEKEFRKDSKFQNIKIVSTERKKIYFVSGTLEFETDLYRLIALANECGINRGHLDGPYEDSISITIPGTNRAKRSHKFD